MYYYLIIWMAASVTITGIAVYRKALLQNQVPLNAAIDERRYQRALMRRLALVDRLTFQVFFCALVLLTGRFGISVAIKFAHTPAVWQALRTTFRG